MSREHLGFEFDADPDDAEAATGSPSHQMIHATECIEDEGAPGGLVFGEDVPLELIIDSQDYSSGENEDGRHVLKLRTTDKGRRGWSVVMTTFPYAHDLYEVSPLRSNQPGSPTKEELAELRTALLDVSRGDVAALRDGQHDLTETNRRYLTALFIKPRRLASDLTTGRALGTSGANEAFRLWGLCRDYEKAARCLDRSVAVMKLVESAEEGRLYFQFRSRRGRRTKSGAFADMPDLVTLDPEVRARARDVAAYAIAKALAGPHEAGSWRGRPIFDLVDQIFRDQFNNMNRRAWRATSKGLPELIALSERGFGTSDEDVDDIEANAVEHLDDSSIEKRIIGIALAIALHGRGAVRPSISRRLAALARDTTDASVQAAAKSALDDIR